MDNSTKICCALALIAIVLSLYSIFTREKYDNIGIGDSIYNQSTGDNGVITVDKSGNLSVHTLGDVSVNSSKTGITTAQATSITGNTTSIDNLGTASALNTVGVFTTGNDTTVPTTLAAANYANKYYNGTFASINDESAGLNTGVVAAGSQTQTWNPAKDADSSNDVAYYGNVYLDLLSNTHEYVIECPETNQGTNFIAATGIRLPKSYIPYAVAGKLAFNWSVTQDGTAKTNIEETLAIGTEAKTISSSIGASTTVRGYGSGNPSADGHWIYWFRRRGDGEEDKGLYAPRSWLYLKVIMLAPVNSTFLSDSDNNSLSVGYTIQPASAIV